MYTPVVLLNGVVTMSCSPSEAGGAGLVGAAADIVVLAPARPGLEWVSGLTKALLARASNTSAAAAGGAPLWIVREHTHVKPDAWAGYGRPYDAAEGERRLHGLARAVGWPRVSTILAHTPTAAGVAAGSITHPVTSARGVVLTARF